MYYLQVVEHDQFLQVANDNRVDIRPIPAPRGIIFDKEGQVLADNQPNYQLVLPKEPLEDAHAVLEQLDQLIELSQAERDQIIAAQDQKPRQRILRSNLSPRDLATIAVNQHRLGGLSVDAQLRRKYPFAELIAHVVGYVGKSTDKTNSRLEPVGKKGLELSYQQQLSGEAGHGFIETNARGQTLRTLREVAPRPGNDLELSLNLALQRAATEALAPYKRAALVALEPKTGNVLALVSVPSFDPNAFVDGLSTEQYKLLHQDPAKPLFNRAVIGQYPPGSTIKPLVGLAGLHFQATDWQQSIWDPGFFKLPEHSQRFRDWKRAGHGRVDLRRAIIESCDTFFYDLGSRLNIDNLAAFLQTTGLGKRAGIDLFGESKGLVPTSTWKRQALKTIWYPGETLIATIGQGYMLATPLQLAVMTATVANRGLVMQPRLVSAIRAAKQTPNPTPKLDPIDASSNILKRSWQPVPPIQVADVNEQFDTSPANWAAMIDAMAAVVHSPKGTARGISKDLEYKIAGKTGTAQVVAIAQDKQYDPTTLAEQHLDHALFVGFAPVDEPQIALALIIENGGSGGGTAAPIARTVFDAFFEHQTASAAKELSANHRPAAKH